MKSNIHSTTAPFNAAYCVIRRQRTAYGTEQYTAEEVIQLVAGLSLWWLGFAPGSVHVGFVVDEWHCGRFFSEFFGFPLSI
jgi:hypothetical protein